VCFARIHLILSLSIRTTKGQRGSTKCRAVDTALRRGAQGEKHTENAHQLTLREQHFVQSVGMAALIQKLQHNKVVCACVFLLLFSVLSFLHSIQLFQVGSTETDVPYERPPPLSQEEFDRLYPIGAPPPTQQLQQVSVTVVLFGLSLFEYEWCVCMKKMCVFQFATLVDKVWILCSTPHSAPSSNSLLKN
jgi:hypothetical protein